MATNAIIAIKEDEKFKEIYLHNDGYESHALRILNDHFASRERAEDLIALGDLSVIGSDIDGSLKHSFANPDKDTCVAYGRDRGEHGCQATLSSSMTKGQGYYYLFNDETNSWDRV